MGLAFFALALAIGGMTVPLFPMLRDNGITAGSAASTAALGASRRHRRRIITGRLVDRFFALYYTIFTVGVGISPVMIAEIRTATNGYAVPLTACIALTGMASALLATLPRFPKLQSIEVATNPNAELAPGR